MRKQYQWIQAVILMFIVYGVFVSNINHTAGFDEITTFFKYTLYPSDILLYDQPNNHILHSFLVWLSTSLVGNSLIAIRLPALIAGIISLAFLYRLGKRWCNHHIGMIAIIIMGVTASFHLYTIEARGYTLSILFTLLLLYTMSKSFNVMSKREAFHVFLLSLAIIFTVPSNVFLIGAFIVWQLLGVLQTKKPQLLKNSLPFVVSLAIGAGFYAALLYTLFFVTPGNIQEKQISFDVGVGNINEFLFQIMLTLFNNPALSILLLFIFAWGGLTVLQYRRNEQFMMMLTIFVCAVLFTILQWFVTHRLFYPRTYLYLLPLIALFGAVGIYRISHLHLNIIVPLLLLVVGIYGVQMDGKSSRTDRWLKIIEENAQEDDLLFATCCIYETLYYHIGYKRETEIDYFTPTNQTKRIVFLTTDDENVARLTELHRLENYVADCSTEIWNSETVRICSINNPPYPRLKLNSECFNSVGLKWRKCAEEELVALD